MSEKSVLLIVLFLVASFSLVSAAPQDCADISEDGLINIVDLSMVGGQFGQSGANLEGDINKDNLVNIIDLSMVGGAFGDMADPGVCSIVGAVCGDGNLDNGEECDDGNMNDGDGCSAICEIEIPQCAAPTVDADGDGYAGIDACVQGPDCDDSNPDINPGVIDICGNGIDENCDGVDSICPSDNIPNMNAPTPADLSWAVNAPKDENDCDETYWIGEIVSDSSAPLGSRENPYPTTTSEGPTGLADVVRITRDNHQVGNTVCVLVDAPNPTDSIWFGSWYTHPYYAAGIVTVGGDDWTLIKKVGEGRVFIAPVPGENPLEMGILRPGTFHSSDEVSVVFDGIDVVSRWGDDGDANCARRAGVRLSTGSKYIHRNSLLYRNADSYCNLHTGGMEYKITYFSKVLVENNIIAGSVAWHGNGGGSSVIDTFGTSSDIVFRYNYFHGADYDMNNKWNRVSRFTKLDSRTKRMELYSNVFSLARREYDPRPSGNDGLFYLSGEDIDFHHNIIIQRPFPLGLKNYPSLFYIQFAQIDKLSVRNNLFVNPNSNLFFTRSPINDVTFFNNVLINSVQRVGSTDKYIENAYDWFPGITMDAARMSGSPGSVGHDNNVYYAWEMDPVNYQFATSTDEGFSDTWTNGLLFNNEPNSYYNTLHPGMSSVMQNTMPFNNNAVDISIADAGPISFNAWVEHFRPINDNLKDKGTAVFGGVDYASLPHNKNIDGNMMTVNQGRVNAGPYG